MKSIHGPFGGFFFFTENVRIMGPTHLATAMAVEVGPDLMMTVDLVLFIASVRRTACVEFGSHVA